MSTETEQFLIDQVQWKYQESQEITADRMRSSPIRTDVLSASITCKKCSSTWQSTAGGRTGQFKTVIGMILVTCPSCGNEGKVPLRNLE